MDVLFQPMESHAILKMITAPTAAAKWIWREKPIPEQQYIPFAEEIPHG